MIKVLLSGTVIAAVIFAYAKHLEAHVIFYPEKEVAFYPSSIGLPFEEVFFKAEDRAKLNGWFIPAEGAQYTILFFHGNAGNIGGRLNKIAVFNKLGMNIFIIDYRGYGKSKGRPSEEGLYSDAEAAYKYLRKEQSLGPEEIIIYGESLGGAVAVDLASKVSARAFIVEGTFSRGREMAKKIYPYLPAFFFSNLFDSLSKVKKINAPALFIHSKDDAVVPLRLAERLYRAANQPKRFVQIEGEHSSGFLDCRERYTASLRSFLDGLGGS